MIKQTNSAKLQPDIQLSNAIALVVTVKDHEAVMVCLEDSVDRECELRVCAHLSNVPVLKVNDKVLVTTTAQGVVVTGRIRSEQESALDGLHYEDGKLILSAGKGVRIQCGDALIELTAHGKIKLDGKNIYSISEGRHRIQGSTIELN